MHRAALSTTLILVLVAPATAVFAADDLVAPGAKLELLYARTAPIQGGLTEGVAAAPDGSMYFSEIPFGDDKEMIMRIDPRTKTTTVFTHDSHKSNGLMFDAHGDLIACEGSDGGGRGVARWNVKTRQREVIADRFEGKRFNACNDLCIDEKVGKEVAFIKTGEPQSVTTAPVGNPSNVDFGNGDDNNMLYITVDKTLYRIRLNATGYHIPWAR